MNQQWATFGGKYALTLAQVNIANDQASIEDVASQIRTKYVQLRLVEFWLPFFGPVLGVVLILVGVALLWPLRSPGPYPAPRRAEVAA